MLSAFLQRTRYGPTELLGYPRMVSGLNGGGALLYVMLDTVKSWNALGILRLLCCLAVDVVLTRVAVGQLMEIDWGILEKQEFFSYNYVQEKILGLSAKLLLVHQSASGLEVLEYVHAELKPRFRRKFANRRMLTEYARLAWRRYLANKTYTKAISTLEKQIALTRPASPVVSLEVANVVVPETLSPLISSMSSDDGD